VTGEVIPRAAAVTNAFTVDLEDWYQGIELPPETWTGFEDRLRVGTGILLELLARAGVRVTFFVLGSVAARAPEVIRELHAAGHEIGTHGYGHQFVYRLGERGFRQDLERSLDLIQQAIGVRVVGYRAPFFSLTRQTPWAFGVLAECGIRYDSSIFPVRNYRYGIPEAPRWVHRIGEVIEFPLTTWRVLGRNLPVAGGAYFRLFPYTLTRYALRSVNAAGHPAVFYIHPWELDPGHPRLGLPRRISLPHYRNLAQTRGRLERLLTEFSLAPMGQVLGLSEKR
jgi:polysaccharide deacetylase family protein (PEP-CTERM system associated)